jgi:hypothetical protein
MNAVFTGSPIQVRCLRKNGYLEPGRREALAIDRKAARERAVEH